MEMSPKARTSTATARPYSSRNTRSMAESGTTGESGAVIGAIVSSQRVEKCDQVLHVSRRVVLQEAQVRSHSFRRRYALLGLVSPRTEQPQSQHRGVVPRTDALHRGRRVTRLTRAPSFEVGAPGRGVAWRLIGRRDERLEPGLLSQVVDVARPDRPAAPRSDRDSWAWPSAGWAGPPSPAGRWRCRRCRDRPAPTR